MASATPSDFEAQLRPWWDRAQAGDEAAYRHALTLIAGRLRSFLRRRLAQQPDEVEDLVQEVLLSLHLHRGSYDATVPVSAWVQAIARHRLIDHWRRAGLRQHESFDELLEQAVLAEPVDEGAGAHEARRDLSQLLERLPMAQRRAIELTKLLGLNGAEAAEHLGSSEAAIKVQVHRGLKRLAALVGK
ncbi:sigma-70 family RNA polymerase sigma factor [Pseudorhodoferax sp.]|jgi:RNA polymerase sigma-70 factor (ECF subfamily)|uniref:sigma-70 family RNA polymerase sigma factor n=1 Tax=Pseudorhodoferax sp. TaxID=1993553 RepID=UPI001B72D2A6|nr:sigma-70 family RNA polymerase sigma factor [Pseudorhodoferax sp.]MBP8144482.1 sigma-70 family RNA polymerase sigma factor [Inhella sp.]